MICPECGSTLPETAHFCISCGKNLTASGAQTKAMLDMKTKLYTEKELGRTTLYCEEAKSLPIFGLLVVVGGKDAWKVFTICEGQTPVVLGRGDGCWIRLSDETLEEEHASFRVRDGKLYVTDLDSMKGLQLNGQSVLKEELHDGDQITAGETTMKYKQL